MTPERRSELRGLVRFRLPVAEVLGAGGLRLHLAGPESRLTRLVADGATPYWAYVWPGGAALAAHLTARPDAVRGRTAIDVGTGSGLVALAAERAGAHSVLAVDSDPMARVAVRVNAEENDLHEPAVLVLPPAALGQVLAPAYGGKPTTILLGDMFYDEALTALMVGLLDRIASPATDILVGDIGRPHLPRDRLDPLASYPVRDVGDPPDAAPRDGWVFRWRP